MRANALLFLSLKDALPLIKVSFFIYLFFLGKILFFILYTSISVYSGARFKSKIIVFAS